MDGSMSDTSNFLVADGWMDKRYKQFLNFSVSVTDGWIIGPDETLF